MLLKKCNLAFRSGPQTTKGMFLLSLMGEKQQRAFTCLGPKPTTMVRVVGLSAQIWTEMRQATVRCWSYCQDTASSAFFDFILIFHFSSQLKTSLVVKRVSSEWFFISFFGPEREKKSVDELFPETTVGRHRSRKGCEVSLDKTSATEPFRRQVFHSTPLLENGDSCVLKVLLL